jgi:putative YphP/YqiW family bacilliredoxin
MTFANMNMLIQPMRDELTQAGFQELRTPAEVDAFMANKTGTAVLMINSVCGCAAGKARPGLRLALQQGQKPDRLATVFAGQDTEATARARSYFAQVPPSSPSVALFKDGKLAYFMPRHNIEGRDDESVARDLTAAFSELAAATAL